MSTTIKELLTGRERMELLCTSFPVLRGVPGTIPWDQHKFARWASGPATTSAIDQAAAFVLSVWNGGTPEDGGWWNEPPHVVGRFDVVRALALWDHEQQAAFLAWCNDPFWP
jgi:hypothetical protein